MAGAKKTPTNPNGETERLAALLELDLLHGQSFPDLDRLTTLVADVTGASIAAFTVHDATRAYQISTSYGLRETMPASDCLCSVTCNRGITSVLDDASKDPRASKYRHVAKDPFVKSYAGAPIALDQGQIIGVLAIGHDQPAKFGQHEVALLERIAELVCSFLSQRREAVRALRAAATTDGERRRQLQFEQVFNAIHEGVKIYSTDRQLIELNHSAEELLGLTRDQQMGRSFIDPRWKTVRPDGSLFPPDEIPIGLAFHGRTVRDAALGIEMPSGERRWLSVNAAPVRNPETGAIDFAVTTFKDVTAQHEAEVRISAQNAQLAAALEEAEKASRAKTDFLGVMSHELRTPMNAVLSCATLIAQSKLDPVQRRTLGVLQDAGRQMQALLNDLLDLSSLNADKVRISLEPVQLVRLIEDAAVIWSSEIRAKGLSLSVMIDPKLVPSRDADPARLLQVIGNLVANAIKFTATGGITIQAWPEKGRNGAERVAIEVEDTGPGVPAEAAARIFSAFEQADASTTRKHGGLGLGLHVARRLAVAMGGDIELETIIDQGSRFTVRIDAPLSRNAGAGADGNWVGEASGDAVKDVLCVDDNPRNLYVLGEVLRAAGHNAIEVTSGKEALNILARRKVDVVLLDMVMPDMDGIDMLARLRAAGGVNQETPVIACTANVLPDQIEAYLNAGTAGVIAKPINVREVLQAVAAAA